MILFAKPYVYDASSKLYITDEKDAPKLTWQDAKRYCQTLKLEELDAWRLPTITEMISFEERNNTQTFLKSSLHHTKRYDYWSSTEDAMVKEYAWSQGLMYKAYNHTHNKKERKYVRCVYSKELLPQPFYIKYKDIVIEQSRHIMWEDDAHTKTKRLNFKDAQNYCKNLTLQGYDDWQLPNIKQLRSLVDYTKFSPAIDRAFEHCSIYSYFSSTPYEKKYAETIEFNNGLDGHAAKTRTQYVRCYREMTQSQKEIKVRLFFNYDDATLYIDGKKWGKLHTRHDDFQSTDEIPILVGIHHFKIVRISDTEEVSGTLVLKLTKDDDGRFINVLPTSVKKHNKQSE